MTKRHEEDKLGGIVEAALNHCAGDENWLQSMADDPEISQNSTDEVFRAMVLYITDHLARIE